MMDSLKHKQSQQLDSKISAETIGLTMLWFVVQSTSL